MSSARDRRAVRVGAPRAPAPTGAPPTQDSGPAPPACVHGAPYPQCAFVGCTHYRADGPRDERWAFAPDVTAEDIAEALSRNAEVHARVPGSASPIHLVVAGVAEARRRRQT